MPQFMGGAPVDGWTILKEMPSGEVQEKVRWGEVLTELIGVEVDFANKYKAHSGIAVGLVG